MLKITLGDLHRIAAGAITGVLAIQLKRTLEEVTPNHEYQKDISVTYLHALVPLTGMGMNGEVLFQIPVVFATMLAIELLGKNGDIEELRDLAGELGNMISGMVKSELTSVGFSGTLGTPVVTSGSRKTLRAETNSILCHTEWLCEGHSLSLHIQYRENSF